MFWVVITIMVAVVEALKMTSSTVHPELSDTVIEGSYSAPLEKMQNILVIFS
jgi:hypothetical protein